MLRFMSPAALWWLAALGLVVLLYVVQRRAKRRDVTTLAFFMLLHRHLAEAPWLRRLKKLLSFLLACACVIFLTLAMARPIWHWRKDLPDALLVVVDRSASLGAVSEGSSLLATNLDRVRAALDGLPENVPVAVIASDTQPEVVAPLGTDRHLARIALERLRVRALPGDEAATWRLVEHLGAGYERPEVWWVSDQPAASELPARSFIRSLPETGRNAGITACALRRKPQERNALEAFIEVQSTHPGTAKLEIHEDGELTMLREIELGEARRQRLILPVAAGTDSRILISLRYADDALALDDQVLLTVPPARAISVAWVAPEPGGFTGLALATMPADIRVEILEPDAWPPEDLPDVLLAERWLPPELPEECGLIALTPPRSLPDVVIEPVEQLVVERPREQCDFHPVLFGVSSQRLAVVQTGAIDPRAWVRPLWSGQAGILLAAGTREHSRLVLMTFDPSSSPHLPLTTSYPSLLANSVYYCAPDMSDVHAVRPCGDIVPLADGEASWSLPDGVTVPAQPGKQLLLDRIGIWSSGETSGASALLRTEETVLPIAEADARSRREEGGTPRNWPFILVVLVVAVLVLEAWLFHRRGVF